MAMSAAQQQQAAATGVQNAATKLTGGISAAGHLISRNGAGSGVNSAMRENDASGIASQIIGNVNANNLWSQYQADRLNRWQEQQNQIAMNFNREEAQKNRDWQQMMSNTAHQREVADLKAAGLNPVLSALNGNGAAVGSGATASGVTSSGSKGETDTSANSALVQVLASMLGAQTTLEAQRISAQNNLAVAEKYNATSELVAQITGQYGLAQAGVHAGATRYAADRGASATLGAAGMSSAATRYAANVNAANQRYLAQNNPSSWPGLISAITGQTSGGQGLSKIGVQSSNLRNQASKFLNFAKEDFGNSIVGGALFDLLGIK